MSEPPPPSPDVMCVWRCSIMCKHIFWIIYVLRIVRLIWVLRVWTRVRCFQFMWLMQNTVMLAERLISEGVMVIEGHCWTPSPVLIHDRARVPLEQSFWTEHLQITQNNRMSDVHMDPLMPKYKATAFFLRHKHKHLSTYRIVQYILSLLRNAI